jgi:23S rRNA (adenine2503-C2)-methyltransferase
MTSLPKAWRAELAAAAFDVDPFAQVRRFPSWDGSVRYLFTLRDGQRTEAVYMPYEGARRCACRRWSAAPPAAPSAPPGRSASGAT